ncbi:hypothetical protein [Serratia marcescens]|uniref:hypothetical protein n=1 Tax=Serratia marcescens TaxID=615 RepID=UPI003EE29E5B
MANRYLAECEKLVIKAAGRDLSDDELQDVFGQLRRNIDRYQAENASITLEEAALKAADEMVRGDKLARVIEARNKAINLKIRTKLENFLNNSKDSLGADRPDIALSALLVSRNEAAEGFRASASREQGQLEGKYIAGFEHDLNQSGLSKALSSGEYDQEIADALWKVGRGEPTAGLSKESIKLAEIINKWQEVARLDSNRAGSFIGKLAGYITRQSHDWAKIRGAGYEAWRDTILPRLDQSTFDGVSNRDEFLQSVYNGLASGIHLSNQKSDWLSGFKGGSNQAKRASQERVLHFKDGVAWHEYNKAYGVGNLRESVMSGLTSSARTTGVMRVLGTNPENMFSHLFETQQARLKKLNNPAAEADFAGRRRALENELSEILGYNSIPANSAISRAGATIRAVEGMTKLGGAVISSFNDVGNAAMELRYQGMNLMDAMGKSIAGKLKGYSAADQKEILGYMGIFTDSVRDEMIAKFSGDTSVPGRISRLQRTFFKLNLLNWWTENSRKSMGLVMSNWMARNSKSTWSAMNDDLRRVLNSSGITEREWNIYRGMEMDSVRGNQHMTPNGVKYIPDERIAEYVAADGLQVNKTSIAAARESLEGKLRGYYLDRVLIAMSEPGARTRAMMKQGTQPGTPLGEAIRFGGQFKSFTGSFMQNTIGREIYGRGYTPAELGQSRFTSLANAMRNGNGEKMGLAQLFIWMTALGYVSMQTKLLLKGQTPRPADAKTFLAAAAQGGGLGIMGDFLFGEYNRFGGGLASSLAGPTVGDLDQIRNLFLRARDGDAKAADLLKFGIDHTPFMNLHVVRPAMNYLILNRAQEWLSPGSLERYRHRVEKEQGNTFIVPPSQFMLGR